MEIVQQKNLDLQEKLKMSGLIRSHKRAIKAIEEGKFSEEIVPVEVPQRRGEPVMVETDEAPRKDTTLKN